MSSWFNYESLKLVSFTTTVLFKGSKILPVMVMGKIVNRRKYKMFDWATALMLGAGCVVFMFFKNSAKDKGLSNTLSGVICLILYVGFDSFTSNWQAWF